MEKSNKKEEYYTIDLLHIVKSLWKRVWFIIAAGVLAAAIGFSLAAFVIAPKYSSSVVLYVNNTSTDKDDTTISPSEIDAAQSLVKTYGIILKNRTTLERVIAETGVSYEYKDLSEFISVASVNDTEVMRVTVTTKDADEAAKIANGIATVLPVRIAEIIKGAEMEVIDSAIPNYQKVSPSITKYTIIGGVIGGVVMVIVLVVLAMMDDRIHNEEYILQAYHYPILAKIPDLLSEGGGRYGNKKYGYYYSSHTHSNENSAENKEEGR